MRALAGACLALLLAAGALAAEHHPTLPARGPEPTRLDSEPPEPAPAAESFLPDTPPPTPVTRTRTRFPSGKDTIAADVFRPALPGELPVVLLFHGAHPTRAEKHYLRMAEDLAANGYLSVYVRYFDRGRKGRGVRSQWRAAVHDAVTFASSLEGADSGRVGVVGYSLGAFLTLGRAPLDERIRAVVAYYGGISRDTAPHVPSTAPPTLLLHGTRDRIVPFRRSVEAFEAIRREGRPADLVVYPGARHGFCLNGRGGIDGAAAADAWNRTLAFLDFHLRRPEPQGPPLSVSLLADEPLCSVPDPDLPPFLSTPPRYLAPMGLGTEAATALVNPNPEQVAKLLAAARAGTRSAHRSGPRRTKVGSAARAPRPRPALSAASSRARAPAPPRTR
ncbi:MAG TPA: dienelactone hydrolase family protein [Thermoanaerobaculaceae bacterium]|nr:dienelactone hydrolase family protein [Thermoanaerobaculaceae bacterium]HRS17038.1 dienelactone hydrolase family protein [Thermoanaerobaculaceae bacterium]